MARFSACSDASRLPHFSQRYEPQNTPRTLSSSQACSSSMPGRGLGEQCVAAS